MFIPYGKNIKCYDVNSLYPYVMKNNLYPVGPINEFFGDITILNDIYWIGEVDVSTKKDLIHPYLQIHYKTNNGLRTISPNGSWTMKLHSCEYENALNDYNITIKNGYFFKKGDIFSKFVDDLYTLRSKYPKDDPMNFICKLIMNSLYGRFGMKPIINKQEFVSSDKFKELSITNTITDFLDLDEYGIFVTYIDDKLINRIHKVSVGIASAVTAHARVFMSQFKNNDKFTLYYTDTDSIFIDKELPEELVGNKIGQFKLEYNLKEGVFLGPKIYAGITNDDIYISKVKGFKNANLIPFDDFKSLLRKDANPLILNHSKWFRSLINSDITIKKNIS